MANFGIGIGAFADGLVRGMNLGKQIKQARKENAADEAREKAFEDAQKERNAALEAETNRLMGIGEPPTQAGGQAPVAQPVDAGGGIALPEQPQQPAMSREEARKKAEENLGDGSDGVYRIVSNRMRDHYLKSGDIELADKWEKYAETREARTQIGHFGRALRSAAMGDHGGFLKNITPVLEANYGQGFKIRKSSPVKDKEGNITGYNFEIFNTRTGEKTQNNLGLDDLYSIGLTMGSPQQGFDRWMARMQAAEQAKMKAAAEAGKIQMQTAKDLALEDARHNNRMLQIDHKSEADARNQSNKVQQELEAKVGALKNAGYSDEFIRDALPQILGVGQYKRATSPEEARRLAFSDRMKNDMRFARLPPEKQREIIEQDMALIAGGIKPTQAPAAPAPQPQAAAPNPSARGLPVLDTKTGKVIYTGAQ